MFGFSSVPSASRPRWLPGQKARLSHALSAMLMVWVLGVFPAALLGAPVASAHTRDTTTDQAVLRDSPAVVRIVSEMAGALICHACASDGSDIISPQDPNNQPFVWAASGSGAFISPDGYILTADHVVDDGPNNPADVNLVLQAAAQDIGQRYNVDPNAVLAFFQDHPDQVQVIIKVVSQTVFLSTAYTGQLQNTGQMISYPITRIVVNSPIDQQDTAIIKVGATDMPNLSLADASDVVTGETITSVAFPADADQVTGGDFFPLLSPSQSDAGTLSSLLTSTVETGQITAQKTVSGTLYYETSAIANHGSSGGPVIDDQGRIIGFNDRISDSNRVVTLVSSSVAQEYVRQAGVTNSGQGAFETLWTKAVNEYYAGGACQLTNAASDLSKLHANYPAFGG
jgi:serine protease Do